MDKIYKWIEYKSEKSCKVLETWTMSKSALEGLHAMITGLEGQTGGKKVVKADYFMCGEFN